MTTTMQSSSIFYGVPATQAKITVYWTGSIAMKITSDGEDNWEDVALTTSGTEITHTFAYTGTDVRWQISLEPGAKVENQYAADGTITYPGIKIQIIA